MANGIDNRLTMLGARMENLDARIGGLDARVTILTWAAGIDVVATMGVLGGRLFIH